MARERTGEGAQRREGERAGWWEAGGQGKGKGRPGPTARRAYV